MKIQRSASILALMSSAAIFSAACASTTPTELLSARTAYDRASKGPAAQANPAGLHEAKESLDVAEQSFADDGASQETRDLAYAAERRALIAEAKARTVQAEKEKEQVLAQMQNSQAQQLQLTSAQLNSAKQQLTSKDQALRTEQQRREDAEKRAAQAQADLAKFATVKQETRGMVITLSGALLFASAKFDLLPAAQVKLNDVAKALTEQDPDSKIVVEGHTDSQGNASYNQDLSQHRAESVRTYLISRGISSDRISATGFGPTRAIADNASPEGRADNRRVEIVVQPSASKAR